MNKINLKKLKKNKTAIFVLLVYLVLFIFYPEKANAAVKNTFYYLKELFEIIPLIFVLTMVVDAWVPKKIIYDRLGEKSGFIGGIFSVILGSISAGPIYAAFPLVKLLLKKGASISNAVIILSAWAVIKVPMLVNEAKFLSLKFMALRWIFTVIAILIMGYLMNKIVTKEEVFLTSEYKEFGDNIALINKDACVGCKVCVKNMPEVFSMKNGKAEVIGITNDFDKLEKTANKCPVKAIEINEDYMNK
ncbi:permease [Helicovermis profundi]|uniref:Ferredoxin n=1 Tax=Helicovermis profundi TaxID=3065157 RepID=A0AAU9ET17_9FIRM|nr:hypothetical protein HLPR_19210 [Clostridia bacterium S502]